MRKIFLLTSLIFLAFCARSIAQNSEKSVIPKFNSEQEKVQWIKENPELYKKVSGTSLDQKSEVHKKQPLKDSYTEGQLNPQFQTINFNDASEKVKISEKNASILAEKKAAQSNTERVFSSDAEKENYIQERLKTTFISQEEFNSLPEHKKKSVLSDRNFKIVK